MHLNKNYCTAINDEEVITTRPEERKVYLRFLVFFADLGVLGVDGVSLSASLDTALSGPALGGGASPLVDFADAGV